MIIKLVFSQALEVPRVTEKRLCKLTLNSSEKSGPLGFVDNSSYAEDEPSDDFFLY